MVWDMGGLIMGKRKLNLVFIVIFLLTITLPYVFAHRLPQGRISEMENRTLAGYPSLLGEGNTINTEYTSQFENWLSDNLKGRTLLTQLNAAVQYSLFRRIVKTDTMEGKEGWLFANREEQIEEYQHMNLMAEAEVEAFAQRLQELSSYLENKGIGFYYFQCYNKEMIYDDMYVESILQSGGKSRTEQVMDAIRQKTDVRLVDCKMELMKRAEDENIYFQYVDLTHWNEKGAYLGYRLLMREICRDFGQVPVLEEEDYQIYEEERGTEIYGFAYPCLEKCPKYQIKEPEAVEITESVSDRWSWLEYKEHTHVYENKNCVNDLKILMLGDSFIRMFLKDDIAESFSYTLSIDWLNIPNIYKIVEEYQPDIVVLESVDSSVGGIAKLADRMNLG